MKKWIGKNFDRKWPKVVIQGYIKYQKTQDFKDIDLIIEVTSYDGMSVSRTFVFAILTFRTVKPWPTYNWN